ncbi:MAG: RagB/SusD family nutrient uptake outer membrane protein [Chitinophaga sp.]|uniref:RagB/SusD family nutrient uptake outer membrane protein n=1 Tax=Chitinophaga sp. TaxID=1869181 RepID=UPI001B284664|nr:RagB/SusD family nutrient uptake outer membrane protein [Chitinophaga sp.]MBO9727241.1 RagB/SusD family nutrient uptake outer membrane protein [Chitinophaga sp.]
MNLFKRKYIFSSLLVGLLLSGLLSCKKYLDIVPPNTATINTAFQNYSTALRFLYSLYGYMPTENDAGVGNISACATDQAVIVWQNNVIARLLRGEQNSSDPLFNYWEGKNSIPGISLFEGIRQCYIFLDNVDKVPGVTPEIAKRWKGEAVFLSAYYHYILLRQYGPIPLIDHQIDFTATSGDDIFPARQSYDSCVNYLVRRFDEAMALLPATIPAQNELGRVTSVAVKAMKARLLLTAASPLFNGNSEYYANFKNRNGQPLMNVAYDKEKWKRAIDAIKDAMDAATQGGRRLYQFADYKGPTNIFEKTRRDTGMIAYRFAMVDPWNIELIWGYSVPEGNYQWQQNCAPLSGNTYNGIGPSLRTVETFYTENGLPIDKDPAWAYAKRYEVDPDAHTMNVNLHRDPRYYASVAYDNGNYLVNGTIETMHFKAGEAHGWRSGATNYSLTGFLVQKVVHPQTVADDNNFTLVHYPWPLMRMAELYLSYAEALNEYYGTTAQQQVLDNLNAIRQRSMLPTVQASWAMAGHAAVFTQEEMRSIIRQERTIELVFEGQYFWDIRRWKQGDKYLNQTIYGMNFQGSDEGTFNQVTPVLTQVFKTPASYLFPISVQELSKNVNLVQNPGW